MKEITKQTKCKECGYNWIYSGKLIWATCPSCQKKTRVIDNDVED